MILDATLFSVRVCLEDLLVLANSQLIELSILFLFCAIFYFHFHFVLHESILQCVAASSTRPRLSGRDTFVVFCGSWLLQLCSWNVQRPIISTTMICYSVFCQSNPRVDVFSAVLLMILCTRLYANSLYDQCLTVVFQSEASCYSAA